MWVSALSQRFRFAMTKAGLDLNFHGLRHGNATLSLSAGIDSRSPPSDSVTQLSG
jgi:integrase